MTTLFRIYHNARCSKSRSACALLEARGVAVEVVARPPERVLELL